MNALIQVPLLTRVEGRGALRLEIGEGSIHALALKILEPPRLFEKLVEGRGRDQVVEMVARIGGLSPVAHQLCAAQAFERLAEVEPAPWVSAMRRVMLCGEWIQSHSRHIHLMALPDFLGANDIQALMERHGEVLQRGWRLQQLGRELVALFGGRSVHPVGVRIGGFYRAPEPLAVAVMRQRLQDALPAAEALLGWIAKTLPFPQDEHPFTSVALSPAAGYPMGGSRIQSGDWLDIDASEFIRHFERHEVDHSLAPHSVLDKRPYLVGPLARLNLGLPELSPAVRQALAATGISFPSHNMFHSILARAAELLFALREALGLLEGYERPARSFEEVPHQNGISYGAIESPCGLLWHCYEIDDHRRVNAAWIVSPTSQNQARMEEDIRLSLERLGLDQDETSLRQRAERVIRNYDPCFSCAVH
ncbi:MAG: nickel-dependent hydrogenase large subunit [Gammaproteobacteria bacterium]|nr:nickel-dependent hydrogenase large subunit [Gammaproteobacteria bacterium]MBU1653719.1 nickel-dependent hydrogenase large subunit [Gammaproteobacteria bacterium]MBU1960887.1 nickel-dependent hydrogenase large subunit [Gammaproteobacteria bacterium]